ncbi:Hypothetical predicted protein [Paramuricea clavata]|uniref:Mutator-like transposase domain-containing protein n=1 Tax=Paramuricea clavata TaxID=317549 RepID=A0A7D9I510_PARCT|nr:Hypothetical predicted protein [Paramuricea clavata]
MAGKKVKNIYRKKRKGKPFSGKQRYNNNSTKSTADDFDSPASTSQEHVSTSNPPSRASRRKLNQCGSLQESTSEGAFENEENTDQGYRLINIKKLASSISEAHVCNEGSFIIQEHPVGKRGLQSDLTATCSSCEEESSLETSFFVGGRGKSADVNRRAVYYSIETGGGYESLESFCNIMNMPCMSKTSYYQHLETILNALEAEAREEMKQAAERLRERIIKENSCGDKTSVIDAAVSFDGTWAKRGFASLTGIVFVISVDTGEVLDYHVVPKSCQICSL